MRILDDFIATLVDYGFIPEEVTENCEVEAALTATGDIQLAFSAIADEDSDICSDASDTLAAVINDPSAITGDMQIAQVPEVIQFAGAAVVAPNIAAISDGSEINQNNGTPVLMGLSCITLLFVVFILNFVV